MFEITMQRTFDMPVNKLFTAWSDPVILQKWFAPGDMTVPEATADVREGGSYRFVMHNGDSGEDHIIGGNYSAVVENEKLDFTWQWEGSPVATKVALTFKAISDKASELTLHHSEFITQEECDHHEKGWNGCFANLTPDVI